MSPSTPRISVIMSAFNGGASLLPSIQSVLEQSFTDLELVITDEGSTDNTWEILQEAAGRDARIVLHRQDEGAVRGDIRVMDRTRGELIAVQESLGFSQPQRLELEAEFLDRHPGVAA